MKQHKMFMIDEEICKKLEGINASYLVNKLLTEHFAGETSENLAILKKKFEENRAILKESKRKDKELCLKIGKIEQKEKRILSLTKGDITKTDLWKKAESYSVTKSYAETEKIYKRLLSKELKGGENVLEQK